MDDAQDFKAIRDYWGREGLSQRIFNALTTSGRDLSTLTIDDLAPLDQFHAGGKWATQCLAELAGLSPGMQVLDVGGGLGGSARMLAVSFGCQVMVLDLTASYVEAAQRLTAQLGLNGRVTHCVGNALALPFEAGVFDVVWAQNSGMNIADKESLYAGFHRVLRPSGRFAIQEDMAGSVQPPIFPLMWARDERTNFLRRPDEMHRVIETAGFRARVWEKMGKGPVQSGVAAPPYRIQHLVMGEALADINSANERNNTEDRIVVMQGVFDRV